MKELVGRLTALDPEASESLKVISYFDALTASGVGLDALLRAAAALSGTVAGVERRGRITRFDPGGHRVVNAATAGPFPERASHGIRVWLEREGPAHANDDMVVERLGLAIELLDNRGAPDKALDVVLDSARGSNERATALARLGLAANSRMRMVAASIEHASPSSRSTIVTTRYGMLCATVDTTGAFTPTGRTGLGTWVAAEHALESWDAAIIAYRLTGEDEPLVDATDLGVMLRLVQATDPELPHDDVEALRRLDPRTATVLATLVKAESIRAAAEKLGLHHSTVQARHETIMRELGYDPRTPIGRMRYAAAAIMLRLSSASSD